MELQEFLSLSWTFTFSPLRASVSPVLEHEVASAEVTRNSVPNRKITKTKTHSSEYYVYPQQFIPSLRCLTPFTTPNIYQAPLYSITTKPTHSLIISLGKQTQYHNVFFPPFRPRPRIDRLHGVDRPNPRAPSARRGEYRTMFSPRPG